MSADRDLLTLSIKEYNERASASTTTRSHLQASRPVGGTNGYVVQSSFPLFSSNFSTCVSR